jgi:DNA end-binding protein Ku
MANRALWSGTMSIGPILCPVKAYKAVDAAKEGLSLSLLHREDNSPVRRPFICLKCGQEVSMTTDCIHGYKTDDEHYVVLSDEDMAKLPLASSVNIRIEGFIHDSVPDPRLIVDHYFLGPDAGKGKRPNEEAVGLFALEAETMKREGLVAIGKWGYAKRERLAAISWFGDIMLMEELHWDAELRDFSDLVPKVPVQEAAIPLMTKLMGGMVKPVGEDIPWLASFEDGYRKAFDALIESKQSGKEIVMPEAPQASGGDLMKQLEAALGGIK